MRATMATATPPSRFTAFASSLTGRRGVFCGRSVRAPRWSFPLPRAPSRGTLGVVAAAPSFLIDKLESSAQTHKELTFRLADPDVASDAKEFQKLSKALGGSRYDCGPGSFGCALAAAAAGLEPQPGTLVGTDIHNPLLEMLLDTPTPNTGSLFGAGECFPFGGLALLSRGDRGERGDLGMV